MTKLILCSFFLLAAARTQAAESLDALYSNPSERAPASAEEPWPEDLGKDFVVSEPADRAPASLRPKGKAAPHQKPQVATKAPTRRSRLPASVSDGFELRVRYNKLTTMFWVVKRDSKFDLMFANSGGSRASRSLNEESFRALQSAASRMPASDGNIAKCREASMQMHVIGANRTERTVTMCVTDKTKMAEELRNLSQSLAALVR